MSLKDALTLKRSRETASKNEAIDLVKAEPVRRLNVNVTVSRYKALKVKAAQDDIDLSQLVNSWIDEYLSR